MVSFEHVSVLSTANWVSTKPTFEYSTLHSVCNDSIKCSSRWSFQLKWTKDGNGNPLQSLQRFQNTHHEKLDIELRCKSRMELTKRISAARSMLKNNIYWNWKHFKRNTSRRWKRQRFFLTVHLRHVDVAIVKKIKILSSFLKWKK